jgi:hypothetical protein
MPSGSWARARGRVRPTTRLTVFPDLHAPEIVEHEGRFYIVRVSGVTHASLSGVDDRGWLEVAELHLTKGV